MSNSTFENCGKEEWLHVLEYVKELQHKCTKEPCERFSKPWIHIGTGYCYGPAFGHWDAVHIALDVLTYDLKQAQMQIENLLSLQQEDGMIPSIIWMREDSPKDWATNQTHPPVWIFAAEAIYRKNHDKEWLKSCILTLERQIEWFEKNRIASENGYYYSDIKNHLWESGVDEGIRYIGIEQGEKACIDATSHVYAMYEYLINWKKELGVTDHKKEEKKEAIRSYIQEDLFDEEKGFFFDSWSVKKPELQHLSFEGIWPVITGAANQEQAEKVIDRYLLNPDCFNTKHPIATVSPQDSYFEKRMWRGPAWNSMTMWAAIGCMRYKRYDAAKIILEAALDDTAEKFSETGAIWEFYDSLGGSPLEVQRKPHTEYNTPCKDYLGHNPLSAMAMLWNLSREKSE